MLEVLKNCADKFGLYFGSYFGDASYLILFLIAIVFLFLSEEVHNRKVFLRQVLVFSIIYWCPISAYVIGKYCIEMDTYWRMFWLLPINLIMAYAFTVIVSQKKEKLHRGIITGILCLVIILGGDLIYDDSAEFQRAENWYKIDIGVITISKIIEEDAVEYDVENRGVILPDSLVCQMKQYDGVIRMPYGRNMLRGVPHGEYEHEVFEAINAEEVNPLYLRELALERDYQYVVYSDSVDVDKFERVGFRWISNAAGYNIYSTFQY